MSTKSTRLGELTQKSNLYMLSTRDPLNLGHIQTESKEEGKRYSMQVAFRKKAGVVVLILEKNRHQKDYYKTQE